MINSLKKILQLLNIENTIKVIASIFLLLLILFEFIIRISVEQNIYFRIVLGIIIAILMSYDKNIVFVLFCVLFGIVGGVSGDNYSGTAVITLLGYVVARYIQNAVLSRQRPPE